MTRNERNETQEKQTDNALHCCRARNHQGEDERVKYTFREQIAVGAYD